MNQMDLYEVVEKAQHNAIDLNIQYWIEHSVFTFQWWLLIIVFIGPWIIWWRLVDKKRLVEISLFGFILMIAVVLLDDLGVSLKLWSYPIQIIPMIPRLVAIDQGIIIVAHMLVFQYCLRWRSFLIVNIIMAIVFSYIAEPITVWLSIYKLTNWKYSYSLPIYVLKAVLIRLAVEKAFTISKKASSK